MSDEGGRRPKRRCARSKLASTSMPSAVHYVGYVEDDETPEMIMAKFAELERIQKDAQEKAKQQVTAAEASATPAGDEGDLGTGEQQGPASGQEQELTDEQLMEVFKQTSMFNVKTALNDNEMLMAIDDLLDATEERYGSDGDFSEGEDLIRAFWSDDEDESNLYLGVEEDEEGRPRRRRGPGVMSRTGSGLGRQPRGAVGAKGRHNVVTTFNAATQALIRRKVRVVDRDEIMQLRIPPPPIPLAWGRTVRTYVPAELRGERTMAVPCLAEPQPCECAVSYREVPEVCGAAGLASGAPYQAALVSPGWEADGPDPLQRLSKAPLPKLVPTGFIFIWVQKQHIHQVCKLMTRLGYVYVENLTWVYLAPSASILALPSPLVRTSHLTLFIFRKEGTGKDIELRHQRNPDVTFDCVAREPSGSGGVPEEAFVAIETLLPTGKGKFLELWAPRGVQRPGWTHVVEVGSSES